MNSTNQNNAKIKKNLPDHQIDSAQLLLDIQLNLIYCLETIYSYSKAFFKQIWSSLSTIVSNIYFNSALYSLLIGFKTRSLNNETRRNRLMIWLQRKLKPPFRPTNYNTDWRDGIKLCALCESIIPGCCPRYDLLEASNHLDNLKLALFLVENHLKIKPDITEMDIYECKSEAKLVHLLSQMRLIDAKASFKTASTTLFTNKKDGKQLASIQLFEQNPKNDQHFDSVEWFFQKCSLIGMGIRQGVRSRRCRFSIHHGLNPPNVSFLIEILGPNGSFCLEKLTIDSPQEDIVNGESRYQPIIAQPFYNDEMTQNLIMRAAMKVKDCKEKTNLKMPLFCELKDDHVLITYIPLFAGEHRIGIIRNGRYVMHSPFFANIEETEYLDVEPKEIGPRFIPGLQYPLCLLKRPKNDFSFDSIGTVTRKKILKKTIVYKGQQYDYETYMKKLKFQHSKAMVDQESESEETEEEGNRRSSMAHSISTISEDSRTPSAQSGVYSKDYHSERSSTVKTEQSTDSIEDNDDIDGIPGEFNGRATLTQHTKKSPHSSKKIIQKRASTLPPNSGHDISSTEKKSGQKTFKQRLLANNESFKKEFNEMSKNLMEKFKRHKT